MNKNRANRLDLEELRGHFEKLGLKTETRMGGPEKDELRFVDIGDYAFLVMDAKGFNVNTHLAMGDELHRAMPVLKEMMDFIASLGLEEDWGND